MPNIRAINFYSNLRARVTNFFAKENERRLFGGDKLYDLVILWRQVKTIIENELSSKRTWFSRRCRNKIHELLHLIKDEK